MTMIATPRSVSAPFLDRDLSWLEFNRRVLHEAIDDRTPLLERVKFLAIFTSNLDEFFMKRVGLLKRKTAAAVDASVNGSVPYQHLLRVREAVLPLLTAQAECWTQVIHPELTRQGIHLLAWSDLSDSQRDAARRYFRRNVFPVLTPLAVDPGHPFPFISNLSTSLGVTLQPPDGGERLFARVKVPDVFPQWTALPEGEGEGGEGPRQSFVRLLDVIRWNLADLFPGMNVVEAMPFRVTRNAEVELDPDDEAESLADQVEEELRQRRFERVVRLEYGPGGGPAQLQLLMRKLDLSEADLYPAPAEMDFTDLFQIAGLNRPELKERPGSP